MPKGRQGKDKRWNRRHGDGPKNIPDKTTAEDVAMPEPARSGPASRVNYNIMKNYESPVQVVDYADLLLQRGMYVEPMHNDEYCSVAKKLLTKRLGELKQNRTPLMPGEHQWLLRMYNMHVHFLILMFPRHSTIGDVGDTMGVSCSVLLFDCMMLCLACYTELLGGLEQATRGMTDATGEGVVRALLSLHGPETLISRYTQLQLIHSWECMAKRVRDVWPSEDILQYRWCLMLRTSDLCVHGENLNGKSGNGLLPNGDGGGEGRDRTRTLDAHSHYVTVDEDGWAMCSARFQQEVLFYFVQTEQIYLALHEEVMENEYREERTKEQIERRRQKRRQQKQKRKGKITAEIIQDEERRSADSSTRRFGDKLCRKILDRGCTFEMMTKGFEKHFQKACDGTSNDTFIKEMARRWADTMIYPGAKCHTFFENKYSAAPDTSEILRFIFSVSLRTWIEHSLPRQTVNQFLDAQSTGQPLLADVSTSMLLQQMVGMHSSEIAWDRECYLDEADVPKRLLPAYCTKTDKRGYQKNNTKAASFDLSDTEVFSLDRYRNTWTVPIHDRNSRKIPAVVRLCGAYWTYSCGKYYRCRSMCQAFVLWILLVVSDGNAQYFRPNGDRFDMGFMLSLLEEIWNGQQDTSAPNRTRQWIDHTGKPSAEGCGILVVKKRIDK